MKILSDPLKVHVVRMEYFNLVFVMQNLLQKCLDELFMDFESVDKKSFPHTRDLNQADKLFVGVTVMLNIDANKFALIKM